MDLSLSLRYQEQNDNKAIILTDTTTNFNDIAATTTTSVTAGVMYQIAVAGTYDFTTIGADDNVVGTRFVAESTVTLNNGGTVYEVTPAISEIVGATLDIAVKDVTNTTTVKPQIDLLALFGPFASQDDMVYTITAAIMGDTSGSLLVDGLYTLTYIIESQITTGAIRTDTLTVTILVYGQVKVATYQKLRQIPSWYMCNDGRVKSEISEADLCGAYLTGIENSAYIAKTEELINMLIQLDSIIKNGSNITW